MVMNLQTITMLQEDIGSGEEVHVIVNMLEVAAVLNVSKNGIHNNRTLIVLKSGFEFYTLQSIEQIEEILKRV